MKVNSEISLKKKKRRHDDTEEPNEDVGQENQVKTLTSTVGLCRAKDLIESHYELYENVKQHQIKRLKLVKESLLDSLRQPDHDVFQADEVPVESSPAPQEVHKRIENLTAKQEEKVKQIYRERNKTMRNLALLDLKEAGCEASLGINEEDRYPLVFPDIEELLSHLQYNRNLTRWLQVKRGTKLRNSIILCVEGPGLEEYKSQLEDCPSLSSYKVGVEFVSPLSYGDSIEHALASKLDVKPPSKTDVKQSFQNMKSSTRKDGFVTGLDTMFNINWVKDKGKNERSRIEKNQSTDKSNTNVNDLSDSESKDNYEYCLKNKQVLPVSLYKNDNFSRLELVMSPREMANEKYPLPFLARYEGFVNTKEEYTEVTETSPMFGLDCEMCETTAGSELTRISIVNEKHEVVYEKLVKPYNKIVNYLTKYSGITAKMLADVQTRLSDVQAELRTLLPSDAILVGQSLNCDLVAMQMMHPYVIDTSLIFNLSGERRCKAKLKTLCAEFISEKIQDTKKKGHDSLEDACAALKLVQAKLSHSLEWGDAVLGYKRTENESRIANQELREKEKQSVKEKYRLALNGRVDDASRFLGPTHQDLSSLLKENSDGGVNLKKRRRKESEHQDESLNGLTKNRKVEEGVDLKETSLVDPTINYLYSQVAIIGSKEVRKKYKANLTESARERVTFYKANTSKDVMSKVLELDSEEDTRRLIIAHLKSPCVCQVEKWSLKLKSELRENDLVCISMCGSEGTQSSSVRGAFFATLPYLDNLPHVKQLVHSYLESCGHTVPDNNLATS